MDYKEAVEYILSIPKFASKIGLDNIGIILSKLNNPQEKVKSIHIAGTNGKGSTSCYMEGLLMNEGCKVGMFTSPHLVTINERFRINGEIISNDEFTETFNKVIEVLAQNKNELCHPSYFEFLFIMATIWFEKNKLDYVIYETGLGGRLDATNIIIPQLSIITSIGMDHMQYLGDSIEKIAFEKAGIIKKRIPILYFKRDEESAKVIEQKAIECESNIYRLTKSNYEVNAINNKTIDFSFNSEYYNYGDLNIRKTGIFQIENSMLAILGVSIILSKGLEKRSINLVLTDTIWEGRMEEVLKDIYVDGAHNEEAILVFINTINDCYQDKQINLLFAVANDKDYSKMIKNLCQKLKINKVYITAIEGERTTPVVKVENFFRENSVDNIVVISDIEAAFNKARSEKSSEDRLFCVGSLYLAGTIKKILRRNFND